MRAALSGRFSRADVTRSPLAREAIFPSTPADAVWYAAYQDMAGLVDPVMVRAYDRVGNPLAAVKMNPADGTTGTVRVVHGFDWDGNPLDGFSAEPMVFGPQDFVVDGQMIYCAMGAQEVRLANLGYSTEDLLDTFGSVPENEWGTAWENQFKAMTRVSASGFFYRDFFRVYRRNGDRVPFPQLHGAAIYALARDSAGHLYTGGRIVGPQKLYLRKYDPEGNLLWSAGTAETPTSAESAYVFQVLLSPDETALYALGVEGDGDGDGRSFLRRYATSDGAVAWTRRIYDRASYAQFRCATIDPQGRIYTACTKAWGYSADDARIHNIPYWSPPIFWYTDGTVLSFESGAVITGAYEPTADDTGLILWDTDGSYLCSAQSGSLDWAVFSPSEALVHVNSKYWHYDTQCRRVYKPALRGYDYSSTKTLENSPTETRFAVDAAGRTYYWKFITSLLGPTDGQYYYTHWGVKTQDNTRVWHKTAASGTLGDPWDRNWSRPIATRDFPWRAIQPVVDSGMPSLSLQTALAVPSWQGDAYTAMPGLAMRISPALFSCQRDYVGPVRPGVYRLYLAGDPVLELPMTSFQLRRSLERRFFSVVIGGIRPEWVIDISARIGQIMTLKKGIKISSGIEMLDVLLSTPLQTMQTAEGGKRGSLTLSSSDAEPTPSPKTRTLRGISYVGSSGGKRRVRCEVDTWLSPGDTVRIGGGESFIAGELVYYVSPVTATLEVVEAAPS